MQMKTSLNLLACMKCEMHSTSNNGQHKLGAKPVHLLIYRWGYIFKSSDIGNFVYFFIENTTYE